MHSAGEVNRVVDQSVPYFTPESLGNDGGDQSVQGESAQPAEATELPQPQSKPTNDTAVRVPNKTWVHPLLRSIPESSLPEGSLNLEDYPTFEQARMFLERYPAFDRIGRDQMRGDFFYHLIEVYESLIEDVRTDARGKQAGVQWEANFEKALTITQNDLGIDVRAGEGVKDVLLIEPEGDVRNSTTELDRVDTFIEERMGGWDEKLKTEFREIWSAYADGGNGLEDKGALEIRFDQTIERWLENYRGMPIDVVEKIMAFDIPREDLPRHVDNAIYKHGLVPPEVPDHLERNVAGRSIAPEALEPESAELMLDADTYIDERLKKLSSRASLSEQEIAWVREAFYGSMESRTFELAGDAPVALQADLNMSYESALESWLVRKVDRLYDFQLGHFDKNTLPGELMDAARNSGLGLEAALGVIEIGLQHGGKTIVNAFDYLDGIEHRDGAPEAEGPRTFLVNDGTGGKKRITVPEDAKSGGGVNIIDAPVTERDVTRVVDMSRNAMASGRDVTVRIDAREYRDLTAERAAAAAEQSVTRVYYSAELVKRERQIAAENKKALAAADEAYLSLLGDSRTPDSDEINRRVQVLDSNGFTAEKAWVDALVADGFTRANAIHAIKSMAVAGFDRNLAGGEVRLVIDNAVKRPELIEEFRGSFYPEDMEFIADRAIDAVMPHRSGVIPLRPKTLGDGVGRGVETGVSETRATDGTFASAGRVTEGGRKARVEREKDGSRKLSDAERLTAEGTKAGKVVEGARRH